MLLEVRQVAKAYGAHKRLWKRAEGKTVLQDVSLYVEEGECLGIVGESGSGKTTLSRLILGLERPDAGRILFRGADIHSVGSRQLHALRRNIQAVFQNSYHALNPRMNAGDIVIEPLLNYGRLDADERRLRQSELLKLVGLSEEDANKVPHQFSGGQQQRLGIARALALQPELIVLDEAVSSLDRMIQQHILRLLRQLKTQNGLSYLFITHDLEAAEYLCDRIAVIESGRVVDEWKRGAPLEALKHPASRRLLDARLATHPRYRSAVREHDDKVGWPVTK